MSHPKGWSSAAMPQTTSWNERIRSRVHGILLSASIADEGKVIKCGKNLQRQTCSSDCHLQPIGMFC